MPIVDVLVRREPELLNAMDRYGYSPMHVAAINGHFVVGMGLGVRGARVGGRDDAGDDVLDVCARRGHGRFLEYAAAVLKRQQQGGEEEEEEWGERLGKTLKIAIEAGEVKAVEVLLRAGGVPRETSWIGRGAGPGQNRGPRMLWTGLVKLRWRRRQRRRRRGLSLR